MLLITYMSIASANPMYHAVPEHFRRTKNVPFRFLTKRIIRKQSEFSCDFNQFYFLSFLSLVQLYYSFSTASSVFFWFSNFLSETVRFLFSSYYKAADDVRLITDWMGQPPASPLPL